MDDDDPMFETGSKHYLSEDAHYLTNDLSISDVDSNDPPETGIDITLRISGGSISRYIEDRKQYFNNVREDGLTEEELVQMVVEDLFLAVDAQFNTVTHTPLRGTLLERTNQTHWEKAADGVGYDEYQSVLWEITEEMWEEQPDSINTLSVPSVLPRFLTRVVEDEDYTVPRPGRAREIVRKHLEYDRKRRESRQAINELNKELQKKGIDPRHAISAAESVSHLLVTDEELQEKDNE